MNNYFSGKYKIKIYKEEKTNEHGIFLNVIGESRGETIEEIMERINEFSIPETIEEVKRNINNAGGYLTKSNNEGISLLIEKGK